MLLYPPMGQQLLLLWKWSVTLVTAAYPWGISIHGGGRRGKIQKKKKSTNNVTPFCYEGSTGDGLPGLDEVSPGLECI